MVISWRKGGGSFEIRRPRSRWLKNYGPTWTKGVEGLENRTIVMDVVCVSSLVESMYKLHISIRFFVW